MKHLEAATKHVKAQQESTAITEQYKGYLQAALEVVRIYHEGDGPKSEWIPKVGDWVIRIHGGSSNKLFQIEAVSPPPAKNLVVLTGEDSLTFVEDRFRPATPEEMYRPGAKVKYDCKVTPIKIEGVVYCFNPKGNTIRFSYLGSQVFPITSCTLIERAPEGS